MNIISSWVPQRRGDISGYKTSFWFCTFMNHNYLLFACFIQQFLGGLCGHSTNHSETLACMHAWGHLKSATMQTPAALTCTPTYTEINLHPLNCIAKWMWLKSISIGAQRQTPSLCSTGQLPSKGLPFRLFNEDRTALVPGWCFFNIVWLDKDIHKSRHQVHHRQTFNSLRAFFGSDTAHTLPKKDLGELTMVRFSVYSYVYIYLAIRYWGTFCRDQSGSVS